MVTWKNMQRDCTVHNNTCHPIAITLPPPARYPRAATYLLCVSPSPDPPERTDRPTDRIVKPDTVLYIHQPDVVDASSFRRVSCDL